MSDDNQTTEKIDLNDVPLRRKLWRTREQSSVMAAGERMVIGGVGAMTPLLANLLVVDLENVLKSASSYAVVGYFIRVLVLFGIGVFVSYMHDDETNRVKVFQFGMAAPAMLLATINGSQLSNQTQHATANPPAIVEPVQSSPDPVPAPAHHEPPDGSVSDQFMHGFLLQQKH